MAVKIRLARRGRKKQAQYDVVVADARAPRDGRFIEKIGIYNPNTDPATIDLEENKAFDWVMKGAQPTDTVRAMLSYRGIMMKKHLQVGVLKGAITQEEADKQLEEWMKEKEAKIQSKVEGLAKAKADKKKQMLEAETKVKEARTADLQKKKADADATLTEEVKEGGQEEDESLQEDAAAQQAATENKASEGEKPAEEKPAEEESSDNKE